jgi:hypothetical protein
MSASIRQVLKSYGKKPILYVGEVGKVTLCNSTTKSFQQGTLYKYGITSNAYQRIVYSHMKNFEYFDIRYIKEIDNHRYAEKLLGHALRRHGKHVSMELNGHRHRELFCLADPNEELGWFESLLEDVVRMSENECVRE